MKWPRVLGVAGSAIAGLAAGCEGGECPEFSWSQSARGWQQGPDTVEIPVDAAPWLLRPCPPPEVPEDCALVVDGVAIPVVVTAVGACDLPLEDELALQATPQVIHTLVPGQPLPPGALVTLDCDDPTDTAYDYDYVGYGYDVSVGIPRTTQIRMSSAPAAPPGALTTLELHYTRDDPNLSCTEGDYLQLRVDFTAQFLREGGYIEVVYPNGQVFEVSRPTLDDAAILPPSRGLLKFTAVAIDGERGETVEVDAGAIPGAPVYIPGCTQSPSPGAPALLVPVAWLALVRRRRQKACS